MTVLIVTNDFPPRIGGIETFVAAVCGFLDNEVVVLTSSAPRSERFDRELPFEVRRRPGPLLPIPGVRREAVNLLRSGGADRVLFGAAAPLALLAPALRQAGARRIVALTHGHETWWARVPIARQLLRRIGDDVDALSTISDFASGQITRALSAAGRTKVFRLPPPVDLSVFRPGPPRPPGHPRCVSVGRFVPRKGFDVLLTAWRYVLDRWPDGPASPELLLVGDGPLRSRLQRRARYLRLGDLLRFTGALPPAAVAAELQQADVFALPVRTRRAGLEPEGLGLAAIEAAACGLPVVVGRSGGTPEALRDGVTGYLVDPTDPRALADRLRALLLDRDVAAAMGSEGRRFVAPRFGAVSARRQLRAALRVDRRPIPWPGG